MEEEIKPHEFSQEEIERFEAIQNLISEGWEFMGNIHSVDRDKGKHYYRITLKRGEEEKVFASDFPYPG